MLRRVVTGTSDNGNAIITSDGTPPRVHHHTSTPGFASCLLWTTDSPAIAGTDPTPSVSSFVPGPGETVALAITFPPASVFTDPAFDPAAARAEQKMASPGLAELFEPDNPGMHTTPTVDYGVVIEGEIVLDLDGDSTLLRAGDVIVQNGTRHAWRNPGPAPATVFFVLIGAAPTPASS